MNDRELAVEVYRNLGHISKGVAGIMAALARRWALGPHMETKQTTSAR